MLCMFTDGRLNKGDRVSETFSAPTQQETLWEETLDIKVPASERDVKKFILNLREISAEVDILE